MVQFVHRLDRKIRILREKRNGAFDRDQYFLERALRARTGRKVRLALRRMQPVVMHTPRWSEAEAFLDDITMDIRLGRPSISARALSLHPMSERPVNEAWRFLLTGIVEFCHLVESNTGIAAADRNGFKTHLHDLFFKVRTGPRRALLVHGVEHLHAEALEDLIEVFTEYRLNVHPEDRRLNLLLASSVDGPGMEMEGALQVQLNDYSSVEAIETLVEHLGPTDRNRLDQAVQVVGGVPALLSALGSDGIESGALAYGRSAIWKALGSLAEEVRGALEIVNSDETLGKRLELISSRGPVERNDDEGDVELTRAGLIQEVSWGRPNRVEVRAPVFAELALG